MALLDDDQYRELLEIRLLDPDALRVVYAARLTDQGVVVAAGEDDLEHLLGFVTAEANHEAKRRRRAALDELVGIMEAALRAGR